MKNLLKVLFCILPIPLLCIIVLANSDVLRVIAFILWIPITIIATKIMNKYVSNNPIK